MKTKERCGKLSPNRECLGKQMYLAMKSGNTVENKGIVNYKW
jgi:hypothetical protein